MSTGNVGRIQAGAAFIAITADHKEFEKDTNKIRSAMGRLSKDMVRFGSVGAGAAGGVLLGLAKIVKVSADGESAMKRFSAQFGTSAREMQSALQKMSGRTGAPMTLLTETAGGLGALFGDLKGTQGAGALVATTNQAVKAALDLSTMGISIQEATQRIQSGLTGSTEVLERFGIELKVSALQAEANRLGMTKSVKTMDELEKKMLRLAVIQKTLNRLGADFLLRSDDLNLQLSLMWANFRDLAVQAGSFTVSVLTPMVKMFNALLRVMGPLAKLFSPVLTAIGGLAALSGSFFGSLLAAGLFLRFAAFALAGLKPLVKLLGFFLTIGQRVAAGGGWILLFKTLTKLMGRFLSVIHPVIRAWVLLGLAMKAVGDLWKMMAGFYRKQGNDELADAYEKWGNRAGSVPGRVAGLIGPNQAKNAAQLASDIASWMFGSKQGGGDGAAPGAGVLGGITQARGAFAGGLTGGELAFGTTSGGPMESVAADLSILAKLAEQVTGNTRGGPAVKTIGTAG